MAMRHISRPLRRRTVARAALGLGAALALLASAASATAQVDPWGPAAHSRPAPVTPQGAMPPPEGGVTRLIEVVDGTPYYESIPNPAHSHRDAVRSRLLPVHIFNNVPVGADQYSPPMTGEHASGLAMWDYLVRYWEQYPNAKERRGHTPRLGRVHRTIQASQVEERWSPPPGVIDELHRQAQTIIDAILEHPFMARSEGVKFYPYITYTRRRDRAGTEVYGFQLNISFPKIVGGQAADGRWDQTLPGTTQMVIMSNVAPASNESPIGAYRGLNMVGLREIVLNTTGRPLWLSEFRGGQGKPIVNPELFDPARPKTDIQTLIIKAGAHQIGGYAIAPDHEIGRNVAAGFLTDWKGLVDRLNGPDAPRAQ